MEKKTTVAVLCWNHYEFVEQCLTSILNSSNPERRDVRIVDNGSQDGSAERIVEFVKRHKLPWEVILNEANLGIPKALNQTLVGVDTPYFSAISSDDFVDPNRYSLQEDALDSAEPEVVMVGGRLVRVDAKGEELDLPYIEALQCDGKLTAIQAYFGPKPPPPQVRTPFAPSQMWRTSLLNKHNGFDERFVMEDVPIELIAMVDPNCRFLNVPDSVVYYRQHGGNSTKLLSAKFRFEMKKTILAENIFPDKALVALRQQVRELADLASYEESLVKAGLKAKGFRRDLVRAALLKNISYRSRINAVLLSVHPGAARRAKVRYRDWQGSE